MITRPIGSAIEGATASKRHGTVTPSALLFLAILFGLTLLAALVSVMSGAYGLSALDVLGGLMDRLTSSVETQESILREAVVWDLRLVRVVMAAVVGASLATCGAAMQGLFGNPLADPGIVGVSSGASLGAIMVVVLEISILGAWTLPAGAFLAGIATTMIIYSLAWPGEHGRDNARLLLVGIAVNAIGGAFAGLLTYMATIEQLQSLTFWSMGSLASSRWTTVAISVPPAIVGIALLLRWSRPLDLLALGERQARHLGVDVKVLRRKLIVVTALLVAAAVSFAGTIGFVDLVVPHLFRLMIGPGHRLLIPFCAVGGAFLVIVADLIARTIDPPSEVPIGILMGALGGPFFLWMIHRGRDRGGIAP